MIVSGKVYFANTLPLRILMVFDWNPLFNTIEQTRGFAFVD